jgi:hypothetical protein
MIAAIAIDIESLSPASRFSSSSRSSKAVTGRAYRGHLDLVDRLIASPHFGQNRRVITLDESESFRSSCS